MKGKSYLYGAQRGSRPFTGPLFHMLVADCHGVNKAIYAPRVAFIALKLEEVLTKHAGSAFADESARYAELLELAIANRNVALQAQHGSGEPGEQVTVLKILHDLQVLTIVSASLTMALVAGCRTYYFGIPFRSCAGIGAGSRPAAPCCCKRR